MQVMIKQDICLICFLPAIAETPEEPIFSYDVEDEDEPQQANDTETHSPLISSIASDKDKSESDKSVVMTTAHQTDDVTMMETTPRLLDSYESAADAMQRLEFTNLCLIIHKQRYQSFILQITTQPVFYYTNN